MSGIRKISEEVFVTEGGFLEVAGAQIEFLKEQAAKSPRHRARICAHPGNESRIHEMLIVLTDQVYIRPHKHLKKSESFHVVEGSAMVIYFKDSGEIAEVIQVGDAASGRPFYFRNEDERFHMQIITSRFLVFHEVTDGPFNRADTVFAPWSPDESHPGVAGPFLEELKARANEYLAHGRK